MKCKNVQRNIGAGARSPAVVVGRRKARHRYLHADDRPRPGCTRPPHTSERPHSPRDADRDAPANNIFNRRTAI